MNLCNTSASVNEYIPGANR